MVPSKSEKKIYLGFVLMAWRVEVAILRDFICTRLGQIVSVLFLQQNKEGGCVVKSFNVLTPLKTHLASSNTNDPNSWRLKRINRKKKSCSICKSTNQ